MADLSLDHRYLALGSCLPSAAFLYPPSLFLRGGNCQVIHSGNLHFTPAFQMVQGLTVISTPTPLFLFLSLVHTQIYTHTHQHQGNRGKKANKGKGRGKKWEKKEAKKKGITDLIHIWHSNPAAAPAACLIKQRSGERQATLFPTIHPPPDAPRSSPPLRATLKGFIKAQG